MAGNVSFVTRVGPKVQAAEALAKLFGQFNADFSVKAVKYKGKEINLISSKGGSVTIGYIRFGDLIVFGIGEKAGRSAIDTVGRAQKSLSQDKGFTEREENSFEKADSFVFVRL